MKGEVMSDEKLYWLDTCWACGEVTAQVMPRPRKQRLLWEGGAMSKGETPMSCKRCEQLERALRDDLSNDEPNRHSYSTCVAGEGDEVNAERGCQRCRAFLALRPGVSYE